MARTNSTVATTNYAGGASTTGILSGNAGPWTFGGWVRNTNATPTNQSVFRLFNGSTADKFSLRLAGGGSRVLSVQAATYGGSDPRTGATITLPDTNWHHVGLRYAGAGGAWVSFLDGVATTINSSITFNWGNLNRDELFRQDGGTSTWCGDMADLFFHETSALSNATMAGLAAGARAASVSPHFLYKMETDEGASILNSGSTTGHNLTVTGTIGFTSADPPYATAAALAGSALIIPIAAGALISAGKVLNIELKYAGAAYQGSNIRWHIASSSRGSILASGTFNTNASGIGQIQLSDSFSVADQVVFFADTLSGVIGQSPQGKHWAATVAVESAS